MMMLVPGVKHKIPDNLSRCPVCCDGPNHRINDADVKVSAFAFTTAHNDQVVKWDRAKVYSVHWGINPSHSKTPPPPPLFFCQAPCLKSANCPNALFLGNSPYRTPILPIKKYVPVLLLCMQIYKIVLCLH